MQVCSVPKGQDPKAESGSLHEFRFGPDVDAIRDVRFG